MIKSVEMINWRAYEERNIQLEPGITFLMGSNGAGKTSVLEAISYGLTGEAAMFNSKTRPKLLRDPEKSATVNLVFEVDNQLYKVSRTQSPKSAADAQLLRLSDGRVLATNHSSATRQISKLMGVSPDFLRRIIYMAEGDVFRFLNDPPGEALDMQIRQVLGITQLDQFTSAAEVASKQLRQRMEAIQELMDDLVRLGIRTEADLQERLNSGEKTRELLLEQLEKIKAQFILLQTTSQEAERLQELVTTIANEVKSAPERWKNIHATPIVEYYRSIEQKIHVLQNNSLAITVKISQLEGEKQGYQKTLSILQPFETRSDDIPCPVCRKPMSGSERHEVLDEIRLALLELDDQIVQLQDKQASIEIRLGDLRRQLDALRELRDEIAHGRIVELKPESTFNQVLSTIKEASEKKMLLADLEARRGIIQYQINKHQTEQAEFIAIQKRLNDLGFKNPEEVAETLVNIEIRLLSIRAAVRASEETLIAQRNMDMKCIYQQVAQLWGTFIGDNNWQVELDAKGMPTLQNNIGRQFDLHQLSGGEKTALLIMLHTIIAHNFSQSDFLMIDEPLEHLDPVNRRSLIRFLVQSYRKGIFRQAIVATFEESLIRKYLSEDGVKVIII